MTTEERLAALAREDTRWFYAGTIGMVVLFFLFLGWLAYLSK